MNYSPAELRGIKPGIQVEKPFVICYNLRNNMATRSEVCIDDKDREAYLNNLALKKSFRRAGGLNPDFFRTGG